MNSEMKSFAQSFLIAEVSAMSSSRQRMFRLMYGRNGGRRPVAEAEAMAIEDVVNEIPDDRLDWAMQQVINTAEKEARNGAV